MSEQRVSGLASRHRPLPGGRSPPAPGAGRPRARPAPVPRAGPGRVHECTVSRSARAKVNVRQRQGRRNGPPAKRNSNRLPFGSVQCRLLYRY